MKILKNLVVLLLIIGGLNWGLVGLWQYDLVQMVFGPIGLADLVYDLVGLAAVIAIIPILGKTLRH